MSRFAVVVVSYNTGELLAGCLTSILEQASPDDEVIVVDNASADGSAALVAERFPSVRVITNQENVGFGAACNQGILATKGRFILLVNPDSVVAPGSLDGFERFMEAHPCAAVAGGRLRYEDGSFQHSSFRFPSLFQVFLDSFPVNWRLTESRLNGRYPRVWDGTAFQIDHPLGALMCVRRAAAKEVGHFDEGFFMYAEEVDWCYRFKKAGWEVWHCPDASAVHLGGRSTRQRAMRMFVELHRSRFRLYRKHYPLWFRLGARLLVLAGMAKLLAQEALSALRDRGSRPDRRERVSAYLAVARL